jgi:glucose-1-phosphate thymidylyltransferase
MKALVLSGGTGARLRPFSYSLPKQLFPIANKPVLHSVLENVRAMEVTDVGIVVGDRSADVRAVIGDGSRLGLDVTYLPQDAPRGLADCVRVGRDYLGDDDFVMYLGDTVFSADIAGAVREFTARRPAAHVVVQAVPDPRAFGVLELAADGSVLRVEEKPQHPRSDLALTGVYFFTPAIHQAVAAIAPSKRGELEITDAIQWLLDNGQRVTASEHTGYYKDTGCIEDVLDCNRELLDALHRSVDGKVDEASVLTGAVVVAPTARVLRSSIDGPVIIGPGALVEDSRLGPHTSVGPDCVLRGAWLENSIALEGATISGARGLHSCVIGRFATVSSGAQRHCLVIGDQSRVEVAA